MSRLKILIFLIAVAVAGTCVGVAWWFYSRVMTHDEAVKVEIKQIAGDKKAPPDPGLRRFDLALETVKSGDFEGGREALYELIKHFPSSKRADDAKRIIGEMNMDKLFSPDKNPQKVEYIVQPGNSLLLIAGKNHTTIDAILRINGMMSTALQPGDHLSVIPLDFEILVNVTKKTVTLIRNERFFKEYQALEIHVPAGIRVPVERDPDKKLEMEISDKPAWFEGKRIQSTHPSYLSSDKWLMGSKIGLNIRSLPQAKAVGGPETIVPKGPAKPAPTKTSSKTATKGKSSSHTKGRGAAQAEAEAAPIDESAGPVVEPGIFLPREDIEELFSIIRTKTKVKVVR